MTADHRPVTTADIAEFLARLCTLRTPAQGGDPATYTAALTPKADLLARIAAEYPDDEPTRHIAGQAFITNTKDTSEDIR